MKLWKKTEIVLQAALIAFALQFQFSPQLNREDYKSGIHYLYAEVTNLLGEYSLNGLLIFALAAVFLCWVKRSGCDRQYCRKPLPFFFSFCLLTGQSCAGQGGLSGCFGDAFRAAGFLIAFAGYAVLFRYVIALFLDIYQKAVNSEWKPRWAERLLGEKCLRNVFLLLMALWFPVILLSYPGNLCYDGLGQIEQGLGLSSYSTHHPLLHTLIMSGIIKIGRFVFGSNDPGLFLYILLQAAALGLALAGTVSRLAKRQVSLVMRLAVVCVYVLAPMYSNMVSTAIKDVPFMAAVIWYILLLEELVTEGFENKKPLFWVKLVLVQALVGLLRNNGIYVVLLTGIILALAYRRKAGGRRTILLLLCMAVLPFLVWKTGNEVMIHTLSAEKGSIAEMLSVPFQQTARYLQLYRQELTEEERAAIEAVLTDVNTVAANYDPDIADPVKALYQKNAGLRELAAYFKVWFTGFFRHPKVYIDASFVHVYGWFDPGVTNAVRYEAVSDLFRQGGLFPGAEKLLIFVYRFAEYIPFLALLENVGVYTWLLFILAGFAFREKSEKGLLLAPLFISLLICMVSPCFYLHPRYAYPIMFTIPFLYGIMNQGRRGENVGIEKEL